MYFLVRGARSNDVDDRLDTWTIAGSNRLEQLFDKTTIVFQAFLGALGGDFSPFIGKLVDNALPAVEGAFRTRGTDRFGSIALDVMDRVL